MPNWSEMDLMQVDLRALPPEQRGELYAEVKRRARIERAQVLRAGGAWLRRVWQRSKQRRSHVRVQMHEPRGPLDLIFGGRV
jgi:hypothetical protein